jgi:hypothetical protein
MSSGSSSLMSSKKKVADDAETRRHQASAVKRAKKQANAGGLDIGQAHFIIAANWFRKWSEFVTESQEGSPPPGPVDNNDILDLSVSKSEPQVRMKLVEHEDYEVVTEPEWKLFFEWFVSTYFWAAGSCP